MLHGVLAARLRHSRKASAASPSVGPGVTGTTTAVTRGVDPRTGALLGGHERRDRLVLATVVAFAFLFRDGLARQVDELGGGDGQFIGAELRLEHRLGDRERRDVLPAAVDGELAPLGWEADAEVVDLVRRAVVLVGSDRLGVVVVAHPVAPVASPDVTGTVRALLMLTASISDVNIKLVSAFASG